MRQIKQNETLDDVFLNVKKRSLTDRELLNFGFTGEEIPTLSMTTEAFWKIDAYAEIVRKLANAETIGELIAHESSCTGIVKDIYMSKFQIVNSVHCIDVISAGDEATKALKERNLACNIPFGWWHSHKGINLYGHSREDDNQLHYLFGYHYKTCFPIKVQPQLDGSYTLLLDGPARFLGFFFNEIQKDNSYTYKPSKPLENLIELDNGWYQWNLFAQTSYSLVLLDRGRKPYVEMWYKNPFFSDSEKENMDFERIYFKRIPLLLYDTDNFLSKSLEERKREVHVFEEEVKRWVVIGDYMLDPNLKRIEGNLSDAEVTRIANYEQDFKIFKRKSERELREMEEKYPILPVTSRRKIFEDFLEKYIDKDQQQREEPPAVVQVEQTEVVFPAGLEESKRMIHKKSIKDLLLAKYYQSKQQEELLIVQQEVSEAVVYESPTVVELEEKVMSPHENKELFIEKINEPGFIPKAKKIAKSILSYSPVIGALMEKEEVVERVVQSLEQKVIDGKIDGEEVHEIMYKGGVNNTATRGSIYKKLAEKEITIDGKVESKYLVKNKVVDFINNIGIGKLKIGNIGGGLQFYKGENGSYWDALKRNTQVSGEMSALLQGAAIATVGYSLFQGGSQIGHVLEDILKDTKYHKIGSSFLWVAGMFGFSAAMNSGSITALARSANTLYSQSSRLLSKYLGRHNEKVAYISQLLGYGFMVGTISDATSSLHEQGTLASQDPVTVTHEASVVHSSSQKEDVVYTNNQSYHDNSSQSEDISKAGWKYIGDNKFEYTLNSEDRAYGRGISQILMHSDSLIGNDSVMSAKESALLAHNVALTPPSEVMNIGDGTFRDLRNPLRYVIHEGDKLYMTSDGVRNFL